MLPLLSTFMEAFIHLEEQINKGREWQPCHLIRMHASIWLDCIQMQNTFSVVFTLENNKFQKIN